MNFQSSTWDYHLPQTSMTRHDYKSLINKIRSACFPGLLRVSLMRDGCSLLIQMSISKFWCSIFRLSQRCLDEIESLYSAFLWSGSPNNQNKAKVSWEELCYPKEEGGSWHFTASRLISNLCSKHYLVTLCKFGSLRVA